MFVILTVCVYVSPAGTFTKLTASGAASIKAEAMTWDSGTPVPTRVAPLAACIAERYIPDTTKSARPKPLTLVHLQKYLPTMDVPPRLLAASHSGGILVQTVLRQLVGSSQGGQGRSCHSLTLRGKIRFDPIELAGTIRLGKTTKLRESLLSQDLNK